MQTTVKGLVTRIRFEDAPKGSVHDKEEWPVPKFESTIQLGGGYGNTGELHLLSVKRVTYSTDTGVRDPSVFEGYLARYRTPGSTETAPEWMYDKLVLDCGVELCCLVPYSLMMKTSDYMEQCAYGFLDSLNTLPYLVDLRTLYVANKVGKEFWAKLDAMKTWITNKLKKKT